MFEQIKNYLNQFFLEVYFISDHRCPQVILLSSVQCSSTLFWRRHLLPCPCCPTLLLSSVMLRFQELLEHLQPHSWPLVNTFIVVYSFHLILLLGKKLKTPCWNFPFHLQFWTWPLLWVSLVLWSCMYHLFLVTQQQLRQAPKYSKMFPCLMCCRVNLICRAKSAGIWEKNYSILEVWSWPEEEFCSGQAFFQVFISPYICNDLINKFDNWPKKTFLIHSGHR